MSENYVTFDANGVVTGCHGEAPGAGVNAIQITDAQFFVVMRSKFGWQGWTVVNGELTPPTVADPSPEDLASQALVTAAQNAFLSGIKIVSGSTPAVDGTYAVDQVSQMDILAIETSINAGKGFPGGAATFNYPDTSGVMHTFSETSFTNFAAAVRDYVYALKSCMSGSLSALPSQTSSIA
ncbi:hypothetical protein L810_1213 [Burkholderia sp. AU4i]|uniref:hypothetical protein n=1 Tax=Burkholderia sp. AU4i TaxID=1335308 RepID=UPI0003989AFF|nr:hypothetical protein [Burkholderia sp. AU4i]ERJ35955.1 hypothetical protein L810_1213 [Burkholderia sp. AU4i]